jgi:ribonucleotide monophosphatase NagD (HAD superfamily)
VVLCDLDGVIWLSHVPIPGSVDAVARLRAGGRRVVFVTNNSSAIVAVQEDALAAIGIPAVGDVLTSAVAAAALVHDGERVLVCGGPGIGEAVAGRNAVAVRGDDPPGSTSTRCSSASTGSSTTSGCGSRPPRCDGARG